MSRYISDSHVWEIHAYLQQTWAFDEGESNIMHTTPTRNASFGRLVAENLITGDYLRVEV